MISPTDTIEVHRDRLERDIKVLITDFEARTGWTVGDVTLERKGAPLFITYTVSATISGKA